MKYTRIILSPATIGLIKHRLNQITEKNMFTIELAWGNINPNKHVIDYSKCIDATQKETPTTIRTHENAKFLYIDSNHRSTMGVSVDMGDAVYLGNNQIIIKSGKPDIITKQHYITRITLLSRGPEYSETALAAYERTEKRMERDDQYHDDYFAQVEKELLEEDLFFEDRGRETPVFDDDF